MVCPRGGTLVPNAFMNPKRSVSISSV